MTVYGVRPFSGSKPHKFEFFADEKDDVDNNHAKLDQIQDTKRQG